MITLLNLRGYVAPDPLDKASRKVQTLLIIGVNLVLTIGLLYFISGKIVYFHGFPLFGRQLGYKATMILEVLINCLVFSPLIVRVRKTSSFIPYLIVLLPYFLMDLWIESHYRCAGCD